ncbi:MAG: GIY-YIG nuclease family protein [Elusimicrobia bacterium]|nr:GIY-YIG nuclease family protein [Elusimicrobiota bacterium]
MYHVYVLKSKKTGDLYIGFTSNLRQRLEAHKNGESGWTKTRLPFDLVYCETYLDAHDAQERERQLKRHGMALGQLKRRIKRSLGVYAMEGAGWN